MAVKLSLFLLSLSLLSPLFDAAALAAEERTQAIASNSVLIALLDSRYTELAELIEKALLLQALEGALNHHRIAIFAPKNEALERELDPEFRRFLLEPRNLGSLQTLLLHHVVPLKIGAEKWPASVEVVNSVTEPTQQRSLAGEPLELREFKVVSLNDIVREDGVIHGIDRLLIPKSVQQEFNRRRSLLAISAVKPEGAPAADPRPQRREKPAPPSPALQIYEAMPSAPSSAPASASGPGGPLDGEGQVKDFIETLLRYGGYNEMADILVNLTNIAGEMSKLVSEGYFLTVLAPNDEAMAKLTPDKLGEPGSPEQIIYYHIIPEYQTEESMYNAVRRFGRVRYDTLLLPHKMVAQEADGSVKFGDSDGSAYLFDPDIYVDGHISVQGIDGVLFPPEESKRNTTETRTAGHVKVVAKPRRGKLLEAVRKMLGVFG